MALSQASAAMAVERCGLCEGPLAGTTSAFQRTVALSPCGHLFHVACASYATTMSFTADRSLPACPVCDSLVTGEIALHTTATGDDASSRRQRDADPSSLSSAAAELANCLREVREATIVEHKAVTRIRDLKRRCASQHSMNCDLKRQLAADTALSLRRGPNHLLGTGGTPKSIGMRLFKLAEEVVDDGELGETGGGTLLAFTNVPQLHDYVVNLLENEQEVSAALQKHSQELVKLKLQRADVKEQLRAVAKKRRLLATAAKEADAAHQRAAALERSRLRKRRRPGDETADAASEASSATAVWSQAPPTPAGPTDGTALPLEVRGGILPYRPTDRNEAASATPPSGGCALGLDARSTNGMATKQPLGKVVAVVDVPEDDVVSVMSSDDSDVVVVEPTASTRRVVPSAIPTPSASSRTLEESVAAPRGVANAIASPAVGMAAAAMMLQPVRTWMEQSRGRLHFGLPRREESLLQSPLWPRGNTHP